jgi:hypothetical protein
MEQDDVTGYALSTPIVFRGTKDSLAVQNNSPSLFITAKEHRASSLVV